MSTKLANILIWIFLLINWAIGVFIYFYIPQSNLVLLSGKSLTSLRILQISFFHPLSSIITVLLYFFLPTLNFSKKWIEKYRKYYNIYFVYSLGVKIFIFIVNMTSLFFYQFNDIKISAIVSAGLVYIMAIFAEGGGLRYLSRSSLFWQFPEEQVKDNDEILGEDDKFRGKILKIAALFTILIAFFNISISNIFLSKFIVSAPLIAAVIVISSHSYIRQVNQF